MDCNMKMRLIVINSFILFTCSCNKDKTQDLQYLRNLPMMSFGFGSERDKEIVDTKIIWDYYNLKLFLQNN